MGVSSPVSVIAGGAGTGKTSVLKAVLRVGAGRTAAATGARQGGDPSVQIALAGRAAKRMAEATGAKAMTIHRFLKKVEARRAGDGGSGLLIVDESSMVDLPNVYRILRALPQHVDICWVGDPGQLPPIGPGLVFHRMVGAEGIPQVELDLIHRQSERSGIPRVAADIRAGRWPALPAFDPSDPHAEGVFQAPGGGADIAAAALAVWEAMIGPPPTGPDPKALAKVHQCDTQILCPTRLGPTGAKLLAEEVERRWMGRQAPVRNWGLSVGSKILWVKNDYARPTGQGDGDGDGEEALATLMNGTLGVVRAATDRGAMVTWDDGQDLEIFEDDLRKVARGWSISVHKAQGSAWRRVIVPVARSRLLDRTLLYAAVTRACGTAVLVGDEDLMWAAVEAPHRRCAGTSASIRTPPCLTEPEPDRSDLEVSMTGTLNHPVGGEVQGTCPAPPHGGLGWMRGDAAVGAEAQNGKPAFAGTRS